MEDCQRKLIITNLHQLCEFTDCNLQFLVILQSRKVLSKFDVDIIIQAQTNFEKASKLYFILQTRTEAFEAIKFALDATSQSGALNILTRYTPPGTEIIGGLTIHRYHLIGSGRYGTKVYSGFYGDKEVAVKSFPSDNLDFDKALSEIRKLIVLETCKNVVRTFAFEKIASVKQVFAVLELCQMNLDTWLLDNWKYPDCHTSPEDLALQVLKGMHHLHTCSILHRDLKPSNILIKLKHNTVLVKISDAGISKTIDETSPYFMEVSSGVGTEGWMSPEILLGIQKEGGKIRNIFSQLTQETDVFSLGCLMYYVLTNGHHPFGIPLERNFNIIKTNLKLNPEKLNSSTWYPLINWMIMHEPDCRPSTELVLCHPVFWDRNKLFQFFVDLKTHLDINLNETLCKKLRSYKLQVSRLQNIDNFIMKYYFSVEHCTVAYFLNGIFLDHNKYCGLLSYLFKFDSLRSELLRTYFPYIVHDLWYELRSLRDDVHFKKYFEFEQDGRHICPWFPKYNISGIKESYVRELQCGKPNIFDAQGCHLPEQNGKWEPRSCPNFLIKVKSKLTGDYKRVEREIFISLNYTGNENVLRYYEVSEDLACYTVKTDYYDVDLKAWLDQEHSRMDYKSSLNLAHQLLNGLLFLHGQNILHLDLRPSNIVRGQSGLNYCLKICNFANAKMVGDMETGFKLDKTFKGMDGWIPPEIYQFLLVDQSEVYINQAADVFNLGLLFYFILTDRNHAFGSLFERRINIMKGLPQIQHEKVMKNCSFKFCDILYDMIQNDRDKRPKLISIADSNIW